MESAPGSGFDPPPLRKCDRTQEDKMAQQETGQGWLGVGLWTLGGIVAIVIVAYLIGIF